jgi:hypothetical protein
VASPETTDTSLTLMPVERMLLSELIRQRGELVAPIQQRIDAALMAIADRLGVDPNEMLVNPETGAITLRPQVVTPSSFDIEEIS